MLPFFYQENLNTDTGIFTLDEASSKHCIKVLRMQVGDQLLLTNGKGKKVLAEINDASSKRALVNILTAEQTDAPNPEFALAIAFTKNNSRNEWLLEKATEMGISHIFPLQTQRSEKEKLKPERLNNILVAAMLQSQQTHLPTLHESIKIKNFLTAGAQNFEQKFVAHCMDDQERVGYLNSLQANINTLVLIGPEGDFTAEEVQWSLDAGCKPVSFGTNRLRTETAGLYACTVFNAKNNA